MNTDRSCPRCHEEVMRTWDELEPDEQEVVKRLPGSVDYTSSEREQRHRWCPRCWFETTESGVRDG